MHMLAWLSAKGIAAEVFQLEEAINNMINLKKKLILQYILLEDVI